MRIAIFGDLHGSWINFRDEILRLDHDAPLDLVLQVGDAQPLGDAEDLAFMPVPEQHRHLGSYAQVQEPWPIPTLFIGGNHEPWNRLAVLPDGGFLQPNLEYLGRAGQKSFGSLSVAGLSGVFSPRAFDRPRQRWPFLPEQARDASYYRREDLAKLARLPRPDILLLHEWPTQLEAARQPEWPRHGSKVGIEPLGALVTTLRPAFVFCGHMHCAAQVRVGATEILALDNFSERPAQAVAILEGEPGKLQLSSASGKQN
ncbi:MAG: hypothetical protein HGA66_03050 [Holophaga sp.]|nr:hypothetical protein [Holophaga sp.]